MQTLMPTLAWVAMQSVGALQRQQRVTGLHSRFYMTPNNRPGPYLQDGCVIHRVI